MSQNFHLKGFLWHRKKKTVEKWMYKHKSGLKVKVCQLFIAGTFKAE